MERVQEGTSFALIEIRKGTSFEEIRRQLVEMNFSPEEINSIMRNADHLSIGLDYGSTIRKSTKEYFYLGIVLFVIGIAVTVFSFTRTIDNSTIFMIGPGAIVLGASIIYRNYIR